MPENIRALLVILFLSTSTFLIARGPTTAIVGARNFKRRRNLWLLITLVAFLSPSFWLFLFATTAMLVITRRLEDNPIACFFMLLFAVQVVQVEIPGFGVINYLFTISHQRLLTLILLAPLFLNMIQKADSLPFGRTLPDKLIGIYMLLVIMLHLRDTTVTDFFRQALYLFIDVFLPYFVVSRLLKNVQMFRESLMSFVIAVMILAVIGIFEAGKHWLLYSSLDRVWDTASGFSRYGQFRAGLQRPEVSVGSIPLGYLMATAMGFFLFIQNKIPFSLHRWSGFLLLLTGLFVSLSRGPWLGGVLIIAIFVATGRNAIKRLGILALVGIFSIPAISIFPSGKEIINLLPYIGEADQVNVTYREKLLTNSIAVIKRHPWFGSTTYRETAEMEALRQGQGIIDIVNTYILVSLEYGVIGLTFFAGFFIAILLGIYKAMVSIGNKEDELYLLGRALFSTLAGILLIIFTVSNISIIPVVYWSVAGIGMAYILLVTKSREPQ